MVSVKVYMTKFFMSLFERVFKMMKNGIFFHCDSTLGCRVIQYFDLCKLDDFWPHTVDTKWFKITKMEYLWMRFLFRIETSYGCYIHLKVPLTQWAPGPFPLKGKIRVFLHQKVLFARVVHSVGFEHTWALHSTSTRKSFALKSNK